MRHNSLRYEALAVLGVKTWQAAPVLKMACRNISRAGEVRAGGSRLENGVSVDGKAGGGGERGAARGCTRGRGTQGWRALQHKAQPPSCEGYTG